MNTPTTEQKPLYQVLNEQRTQGEWILEQPSSFNQISDERAIIRAEIPSKNLWERVAEFDLTSLTGRTNLLGGSHKADAAYTALAVNNLHILAEALEIAKNYVEHFISNGGIGECEKDLATVKEALNKIS